MSFDADVCIVGGGPAGTASAIAAARVGLRVRLHVRAVMPLSTPGETLHPGVRVLFDALGVEERMTAASAYRHAGVRVSWGGIQSFKSFGRDQRGPWLGYQILRRDLDRILLERAIEVGVEVRQSGGPLRVLVEDGRVHGLRDHAGEQRYRFLIDASGRACFLGRALGLPRQVASPPLRVAYGYCAGDPQEFRENPTLVGDASGWCWIAQVAPELVQWTRLAFDGSRPKGPPPELAGLPKIGPVRGADVTWTRVVAAAGAGYFIAGDAAMVLDPAASNGVLRALLSGIRSAKCIEAISMQAASEAKVTADYEHWIAAFFEHNVRQLGALYRDRQLAHPQHITAGDSHAQDGHHRHHQQPVSGSSSYERLVRRVAQPGSVSPHG
jgi:flavin-dependent dehydrogenase